MFKHPTNLVKVDFDGSIAIITMHEPERRNPFSVAMRLALTDAFHHLFHIDQQSKAIVLTGAGGHFSAGGDISGMAATPSFLDQREQIKVASLLVRNICMGPKPVIAAVEGSCIGAGLALACAADFSVVSRTSKLGCTFVKVGLLPDTGAMWTLTQRAGSARAREIMLSGNMMTASKAHEWGLIDAICEEGESLQVALEHAHCFAENPAETTALLRASLGIQANSLQSNGWNGQVLC